LWHAAAHFHQPFHHQLPGEVDIGLVGEYQRNQGKAGLVERPHFRQAGQASHGNFQGHGDEAFHFFRRTARGFGGNLHLDVGHVRKGIHR